VRKRCRITIAENVENAVVLLDIFPFSH